MEAKIVSIVPLVRLRRKEERLRRSNVYWLLREIICGIPVYEYGKIDR